MYVCMYVCVYACMYVYVCVCVYICTYMCVWMYVHVDCREYVAYSKTEELRTQWIEAIQGAKNVVCPREGKKGMWCVCVCAFVCMYICE